MTDACSREETIQSFVEAMGRDFEKESMPRIAGRVFGLLLLETGPHGLQQLAERLRVSRASVSTNTRLLEERGMIERVTLPGDRRDYYRIGEAPGLSMLDKASERIRVTHQLLSSMRYRLADCAPEARSRLRSMERVYEAFLSAIDHAFDELSDTGPA
ncbi:MAG: MarR family transcriptional regulator [Acidobacteriota bacterium]